MNPIVGIDVGGTFTDLVLVEGNGSLLLGKVPSTPINQAVGVMAALHSMVPDVSRLSRICHGTTVPTNALLEDKQANVGLLTTEGFRDTLEIGRTRRMLPSLYDCTFIRPRPLVPRPMRFEVVERLGADGSVLIPLDEGTVAHLAKEMGTVQAVAVCFIHSWRDAAHERRAAEILGNALPGMLISISADVVPEFREYERFSTTVINASLLPVMDHYLASLSTELATVGYNRGFLTMTSAGGMLDLNTVRRLPVRTILSGPAAGVAGANLVARSADLNRFITCDMGGTSTDVCVIEEQRPTVISETVLAGYPIRGLQLEINTVGAGGGSVAHAGADNLLQVGPQSAGADPGPAAYGRGGLLPTVTDANLVLGRLGGDRIFGGAIKPDPDRAKAATGELGQRLGLETESLAEGIVRVAVARMAGAIRAGSVEKGRNPADFVLMPFGGAGPMHGCDLAEELGITEVLVPICPGNLSALGLAAVDYRQELVRTWPRRLDDIRHEEIRSLLAAQQSTGRKLPIVSGLSAECIRFEHAFDMRYSRQMFEITVPIPVARPSPRALSAAFLTLYERTYGYANPSGSIEVVNLRTMVVGEVPKPVLPTVPTRTTPSVPRAMRRVYFRGVASDWPIYDRLVLAAADEFTGPAIIEEPNATTVILPSWTGKVDPWGNLRLSWKGRPS